MMVTRLIAVLLAAVLLAGSARIGRAASDPPTWSKTVWAVNVKRVGHEPTAVYIKCPGSNKHFFWDNGKNCDESSHKTSDGDRFAHWHLYEYDLSQNWEAYNSSGMDLQYTITGQDIKRYYDEEKYPMAAFSEESETSNYNCYGFAFGNHVWVNDPEEIFKDDYIKTDTYGVGYVIAKDLHCILITEICTNASGGKTIKQTKEKFKFSRVYGENYTCPGHTDSDQKYRPE